MNKKNITEIFKCLELSGYVIYVGDILFQTNDRKGNNRPVNDIQYCTVGIHKIKSSINLIDYLMDCDEFRYTLTDILDVLSNDYVIKVLNNDIYSTSFIVESKNKYILTDNDYLNIGFIDMMKIYNSTKQEYKDITNNILVTTKFNVSASYHGVEVLIFGTNELTIDKLRESMVYLKSLILNKLCSHDITKGNIDEFLNIYDKCIHLLDKCILHKHTNKNGIEHLRLSLLSVS